jgi:hypothetical protein
MDTKNPKSQATNFHAILLAVLQGDQMGRSFVQRVIVYFGQFPHKKLQK